MTTPAKNNTTNIEALLGSPAKIRVLTTIYAWKGSELTERQLAMTCGLSTFGLRHALKNLESSHLVSKKTIGRSNVWSLNENSFHFQSIKPILEIIANIPSPLTVLTGLIKTNLPTSKIDRIILFGSAATGDFNKAGDVDIAIILKSSARAEDIKEETQRRFDQLSGEFISLTGKRLEPMIFSSKEWSSISKKPLGRNILNGKEVYPHEDL